MIESIPDYDRIITTVSDPVECEPCDSGACMDGFVYKREGDELVLVECPHECHWPDRKPVYNEDAHDR